VTASQAFLVFDDLDPYGLNGLRFIDDEFVDGAHVFHLISESPPGVGIADMDPRLRFPIPKLLSTPRQETRKLAV